MAIIMFKFYSLFNTSQKTKNIPISFYSLEPKNFVYLFLTSNLYLLISKYT